MNRKSSRIVCLLAAALILLPALAEAQALETIELPKPRTDGGRPLMQVLAERHSSREYSTDKLPVQTLSDLLWAAFGVSRPESGKRTAPSAVNWQEIDIYVAMEEGLYLYDAAKHVLNPVFAGDIRAATGRQPFCAEAPVNLVYVADFTKMGERADDEQKVFYSAADAAFIGENVYLYCASEGLATVVRGAVDKEALAKTMKLGPTQRVILAQTVGFPVSEQKK